MNKTQALKFHDIETNELTADDRTDALAEHGCRECDVCRSWGDIETSGGNSEATLCLDCYENSRHYLAKEARQIYRDLGDDVSEPPSKKEVEEKNAKLKIKRLKKQKKQNVLDYGEDEDIEIAEQSIRDDPEYEKLANEDKELAESIAVDFARMI